MNAAYYRVAPKTNNEWDSVCSYWSLLLLLLLLLLSQHTKHIYIRWIAIAFVAFDTFASVRFGSMYGINRWTQTKQKKGITIESKRNTYHIQCPSLVYKSSINELCSWKSQTRGEDAIQIANTWNSRSNGCALKMRPSKLAWSPVCFVRLTKTFITSIQATTSALLTVFGRIKS